DAPAAPLPSTAASDSTRGPSAPAAIALSTTSGNLIAIGATIVIDASVRDVAGQSLSGQHVAWTTDDSTVARIVYSNDRLAEIEARTPGATRVTAASKGVAASIGLTVVVPVSGPPSSS